MRLIAAIAVVAIVLPCAAFAAGKVSEVEAEGRAELGFYNMSPADAQSIAHNNARRRALEKAVGTQVTATTVVYNSDLINDLVKVASKGLIIDEEVLLSEPRTDGKDIIYVVRIRAKVKALDSRSRPPVKFRYAYVQRPDRKDAMKGVPTFQDGDEVQVRLKMDKDAYLHIFSVDQFGKLYPLYPNSYTDDPAIRGGGHFVFPDDGLRSMGLRLKAETLEKQDRSSESLMIIATTGNDLFLEGEKDSTITDLLKELSERDQSGWALEVVGYVVTK